MCQNCWTCERGVGTSKIVSMLVVSKSRMQHLRCMASASSFICAQVCQLAQSWTILRDCSFSLTAVKHRRHAGLAVASEAASVIVNMMRNLSTQASDIGTWLQKPPIAIEHGPPRPFEFQPCEQSCVLSGTSSRSEGEARLPSILRIQYQPVAPYGGSLPTTRSSPIHGGAVVIPLQK